MKILFPIIIALLLTSCAANGGVDDGEPVTFAGRIASRAQSGPEAAEASNELIGSYHIRFIDTKNKVYSIDRELDEAVESHQFEITLPSGTYKIYAVANRAMPDDPASQEVWNHGDTLTWEAGTLVPMSGCMTRLINSSQVTQPFAIEVVRQMAKFSISFTNPTDNAITVNSYTVRNLSGKSNPDFWPTYSSLGQAPVLPAGYEAESVARTIGRPVGKGESVADSFYFVESTAAGEDQGVYTIEIDLTHAGGITQTTTALLTDITHANRNDHIVVPVNLTDYQVKMNVLFYPPIGGYPAVVVDKGLNDEYVIHFGSQGAFVITPTINEATAEMKPVNFTDTKVTEIDYTTGMFEKKPYLDTTTGEILGVLSTTPGSAKLEVSFQVTVGGLTRTVKRQILIKHDTE